MKRIFTILLAVLYLALSNGLAMEIHHCIDKVTDITLIPTGSKNCDNCGMPKAPNNCCKNELKMIRLADSYKLVNANFRLAVPEAIVPNQFFTHVSRTYAASLLLNKAVTFQPPDLPAESLFRLHGVFRI